MRLRAGREEVRKLVMCSGLYLRDSPLCDFAALDGRTEIAFGERVKERLDLFLPVRGLGAAQTRQVVDEPAPHGV